MIPIKYLYSEGFPQADSTSSRVSITLRDLFFHFESMPAPQMIVRNASLSYAIGVLLDSIGFSNYQILRVSNEPDPVIQYFFIAPDQNVAEVLNQLATATQCAMFFDEYNNFIVMTKNYLMPTETQRATSFGLSADNMQVDDGVIDNETSGEGILPNIISITSEDKKIYNDGKISYTNRYIQRTTGTLSQQSLIDQDRNWIYKPVLLWEVSGTENTKTINEGVGKQSYYALSAVPLNSDLSNAVPIVENREIKNNIIDIGENVYYLTRFSGYFYSSGEIIQYDAVQFNVAGTGNVWISDNREYQKYFSQVPFNGKIYPTGLIRIYCEPNYEIVDGIRKPKNGSVYDHGRARFGTDIASHTAGLNSYWTDNNYVRGCKMKSDYLFTTALEVTLPDTTLGAAGVDNVLAKQNSRTGIIRNFNSTKYITEKALNQLKSTQSGTVQSSALVMTGPSFGASDNPIDFISYVYKNLNVNVYRHFGTRMRIIGEILENDEKLQAPVGNSLYYQTTAIDPTKNINITGGSGGIAIGLNEGTNNGYYFEIAALSENNIESYLKPDSSGKATTSVANMFFYKIKKDSSNNDAIPIKLWSGLSKILVDDGNFVGQYRVTGEENPTVYDLAIEYENIGSTIRFYLFLNNKLIAVVDDTDPLPIYTQMALFVRGSSKCMFENIYALAGNFAMNTSFSVGKPISDTIGTQEINATEALGRYALSGVISNTYLTGISGQQSRKYDLYYDEFGSILRECAYFNIRYDRAYPAIYAKIAPTLNRLKGYTVSGFYANSYGAEFMIFNATDSVLNLDETTGNYLRIFGVSFTNDTTQEFTVDDYFNIKENAIDKPLTATFFIENPSIVNEQQNKIKMSRLRYGRNEFSINSDYIQSESMAKDLMGWIINKLMVPRKSIGVNIFSTPILQLGDIVTINYKDKNGIDIIAPGNTRFVIYNIEYTKNVAGPSMTLYLSEV